MMEAWTKKGPDGKTITFKEESVEGMGFMYFAEGRITTETWTTQEEHTREQVEEHFADYLSGPKPELVKEATKPQHSAEPELCANPKCRHERGQHWDDVCHVENCFCAHFVSSRR